jgi:hypothetical protein
MQTLGLSESTPRTESRWRALFWPTIRNEGDFDYVTTQSLWICFLVAASTVVFTALVGSPAMGVFEGAFFFFAGVGVRQHSRVAAFAAFLAYLLSCIVLQRYTGNGFGIVRTIFSRAALREYSWKLAVESLVGGSKGKPTAASQPDLGR